MALTDNYVPLRYSGGSEVLTFPVTWNVTDALTVKCTLYSGEHIARTLVYGIDYVFEHAIPPGVGGSVVLVESISLGTDLVVERLSPYTQWLELLNSGRLDLASLEKSLDHIVMLIQQVRDYSVRSVRVPPGSETTPEDLVSNLVNAQADSIDAAKRAEESAESASASASSATSSASSAAQSYSSSQLAASEASTSSESAKAAAERAEALSSAVGYISGGAPASEAIITISGGTPSSFA